MPLKERHSRCCVSLVLLPGGWPCSHSLEWRRKPHWASTTSYGSLLLCLLVCCYCMPHISLSLCIVRVIPEIE